MILEIGALTYPVLMLRDGYVFKAQTVSELLAHDRRTFEDTRSADWKIVETAGWWTRGSLGTDPKTTRIKTVLRLVAGEQIC